MNSSHIEQSHIAAVIHSSGHVPQQAHTAAVMYGSSHTQQQSLIAAILDLVRRQALEGGTLLVVYARGGQVRLRLLCGGVGLADEGALGGHVPDSGVSVSEIYSRYIGVGFADEHTHTQM